MKKNKTAVIIGGIIVLAAATPGWAYVGPGAGLTLVGSLVGVALAILAAIGAILSWPIRRLLRTRREKNKPSTPN